MSTLQELPAFCKSCGAVFAFSGYQIGEGSKNISFKDCQAGPCSKCGGTCYVLDGAYSFIDNILEVLVSSKQTVADLSKLNDIFIKAKQKYTPKEEVEKQIDQQLPAFSSVKQYLPQNPADLAAYLTLFITFLGLLINQNQNTSTRIENSYITNYNININQVIEQSQNSSLSQPYITPKKIGRNEICTCGSGKKYKKCCGQ